nr:MAG TPA: hypothetical protein [Bacteriophage sp.]
MQNPILLHLATTHILVLISQHLYISIFRDLL